MPAPLGPTTAIFRPGSTAKLTFAGNGPATLTLTASKTGYASNTVTLNNVNNGDTFTNQNIALTPAGPTKLAFTTPALSGAVRRQLGRLECHVLARRYLHLLSLVGTA